MTNKKSVINEAKAEFEEIKKFAEKEALKQLEKKFKPQLEEMVNKSLKESNIKIEAGDATVTVDDASINVDKDGNTINIELTDSTAPISEPAVDTETPVDSIAPDTTVDDTKPSDENEINEEDIIFEIKSINEEDAPVADAVVANPFQEIIDKLNAIEKKLEGGTAEPTAAEGEVAIVDDDNIEAAPAPEATAAPAETPTAAPTEQPTTQQTIKEEEYMENNEDAIMKEIMDHLAEITYEDDENTEDMDDKSTSDDDSETIDLGDDNDSDDVEFEIADGQTATCICDEPADKEDSEEITLSDDLKEDDYDFEDKIDADDLSGMSVKTMSPEGEFSDVNDDDEIAVLDSDEDSDDNEIDEMLGVSHTVSSKGQSSKFPVGQGKSSRINVDENKAQYESKLDELKEENNSLKRDIKEFEDSFVELRTSIDEMQTFNAKLALANKLFLNGGLSTEEKLSINESLDRAATVKEAEKIYQKIVKDNNILIKESKIGKIKSNTVNVAASSQPLFEGSDAKVLKEETERQQILAGIRKPQE